MQVYKLTYNPFQGGHYETEHYYFDFREAPMKGEYRFEDDLCKEVNKRLFYGVPNWGVVVQPFVLLEFIRARSTEPASAQNGG